MMHPQHLDGIGFEQNNKHTHFTIGPAPLEEENNTHERTPCAQTRPMIAHYSSKAIDLSIGLCSLMLM
jgi:hypothetical protein